jgi:hypothetical protein
MFFFESEGIRNKLRLTEKFFPYCIRFRALVMTWWHYYLGLLSYLVQRKKLRGISGAFIKKHNFLVLLVALIALMYQSLARAVSWASCSETGRGGFP